jgi:cytochrome P450
MGSGLLNQDGAAWARSRKMWNPAFTTAYMETYLPLMQRVIAEHTAGWAARGEVDLFQEAREITFHVAATALAGIDRPEAVARLQQLFYLLLPRQGGFTNQEAYDTYEREALAAKDELDATLLALIAARRAASDTPPRDVLSMILRARDDEGKGLTDDEVLGHLYILLVAGHETTTTLAAWTLYLLATQPEQRRPVEAELAATGVHPFAPSIGPHGDAPGAPGAESPLSVEAARNLHALDLFIRETGRLHSPVQNVPRGVVEEVEFAGYTLPVGTHLRVALAACHRMPRYFADPGQFDPSRFAPPREEDRKTPYSLVTFGGGPRLCIGVNFANIEVKALAVDVLRRYTLTPTTPEPPLELGFITVSIPSGMPVRVAPRG